MSNGLPMLQAAADRRARELAAAHPADAAFINVDQMGNQTGQSMRLALSAVETTNLAGAGRGGQGGPTADELAAALAGAGRGGQGGPTAEQLSAASETAAAQAKLDARPTAPIKGTPNPLFEYADYTYGISMHIIPTDKYNKIMNTAGYTYIPEWPDSNGKGMVLIASGGRRNDVNFKRNEHFNEDFYFDNLKFTTIVGMNSRNKNSNTLELSFTVVEPYGITLLNRLRDVTNSIGASSWMQIPYMMQIDFFGNTDIGDPVNPIKGQTKYIPVRLIACKVKVSTKGAEYQISAIPFNQQAYSESNAATPANFEVQATTIKDFFSSTGLAGEASGIMSSRAQASLAVTNAANDDCRRDAYSDPKSTQSPNGSRDAADTAAANNMKVPYKVGSYTAAMNSYQTQLVENKHQAFPEVYEFVFDKAFETSKIEIPKKQNIKNVPMSNGVEALRAQAGLPVSGLDPNAETFSINAGTNIIEVINLVMRNSLYIRDQLVDRATDTVPSTGQAAADAQQKPINWYKIVPKIEIHDFDLERNIYSKKITFYVQPYLYYNSKFKDAPTSKPESASKEYHYMYTGKNESILSFDIDFDTMFYTTMTADRSKIQKTIIKPENTQSQTENPSPAAKSAKAGIQDKQIKHIASDQTMPTSGSPDSKSVLVNDFAKSMLSSSRGDMINVKLKIIGDPEFIKQDDVYFNPANNPASGVPKFTDRLNGSLIFDASEIYALLTFTTPVDWDPVTGLMSLNAMSDSAFNGLYRVIQVENNFAQGQFTQTLDMIRIFDEDTSAAANGASQAERATDPLTIANGISAGRSGQGNPTSDELAAALAGAGRGGQGGPTAEQLSAASEVSAVATTLPLNQVGQALALKQALAKVPTSSLDDEYSTPTQIV